MANNAVRLPFIGRVIYPFQSQRDGELTVAIGDLILITKVDDRYWYVGQIASDKGRVPQNNVSPTVSLPPVSDASQHYFATLADFSQQQAGDLSFNRGEILVGFYSVDEHWWYGRNASGREGIFPTSLAWKIDLNTTQNGVGVAQKTRRRASVLQTLIAQLPEELDLRKGDEVIVTGEEEDGWLRGECQGKSGIFPSAFVSFIAEDTHRKPDLPEISNLSALNSKLNYKSHSVHKDQVNNDHYNGRPYGIASYDFQGQQSDELSLFAGQTVYLLRHVNSEWMEGETIGGQKGIFPTSFVEIVVDCITHQQFDLKRDMKPPQPKNIDLLLDFDPLIVEGSSSSHSIVPDRSSNGTINRLSSSTHWEVPVTSANIDSFIARNLNLLSSISSEQAREKQRPASWSQSLTKLQIDCYSQTKSTTERPLPAIPPRRQEIQPAVQPVCPTTVVETKNESIIESDLYANNTESCGSIPIEPRDGGASRAKSYTRPAPPPPVDSPNVGVGHQSSSDSVVSHSLVPLRPAPQIPLEGGDERIEGRRQRAEKTKQRKKEEEHLRDLEMRKKVKEQRDNVVKELLVTEREYCRDLRLTCDIFKLHDPSYLERKGIDVATLFGNLLEVISLSEAFIDQLNQCNEDNGSSEQTIGKSFVQFEPDFRRVYGQYCVNHDNAQLLLEKYESLPSTNKALEEGVASLRNQIVCFNMGSVIIKPVQRIMKYPLILNELIKFTENDHPDKSNLVNATALMAAVATYINESKRKKEIVLKYRDSGLEEKLSQRISKLNMHSVAKKSSRIGMLLKTSLGMVPTTKDSAFEEVEARFSELFRVIQTALRDITIVCEQLKTTAQTQFNISEAVASFYGESNRAPLIDNFRTAQRIIYAQHWNAFDSYVIQHVRNPLTALCEACIGPERLVGKRRDKLLDANIASERLARNRDPAMRRTLEEEENLARNTYAALNSQLMEELPVITEHGYNVYRRCTSSFLHARKLLVGRITKALLDLNEIPDIANLQGEIDDDFNLAYSKAVDRLSRVTFINKSFRRTSANSTGDGSVSPNATATRTTGNHSPCEGLVVQSREAINALRTKYHPEQLFMVKNRCEVKEPLDLAANTGLIVGVIKREDPMGNSGRWFVDAGEVRGFIPAKHLVPVPQSGSTQLLRPESSASVVSSSASGASNHSNSMESFKEMQLLDDEPTHNENVYDLPPSYEEALESTEAWSPHRYCEIDSFNDESNSDERKTENTGATSNSPEKAESPIYAVIEDVIPPQEKEEKSTNQNNVYKVEYSFSKRTNLEIDLTEGELVTVLARNDEAGNSEWWLVENDSGLQGYAPAAYLIQLVVTENTAPHLFG